MRKRILTALLVTALALTSVLGQAADSVYVTIKGQKQGNITAGSTEKGREGMIRVLAATHEMASPRDPQSGLPTGRRLHKPFVIQIPLDQAVPLLYNAMVGNENLTQVVVNFYGTNGQGIESNNFRVELMNASISQMNFRESGEKTASGDIRPAYVEIGLTYQKITWTWLAGKTTTASDDWEART